MTTNEYGSAELILSTASLLMPIITMGVTDGIMRFSMEQKYNHSELLTSGYLVITIGMALVGVSTFILNFFGLFSINSLFFVLLLSLILSLESVLGAYTKGCARTKSFALIGIFRSIIHVITVWISIVILGLGRIGYIVSLTITYLSSIVLYIVDSRFKVITLVKPSKNLLKILILYSFPLISNAVCWQIVNISDKFFILHYFDASAVGIYSVAQKIPVIITTFTGIFIQAWQLTATRQHQSNKLSESYNSVQNIYCWAIGFVTVVSIVFGKTILSIFVGEHYRGAYVYIPLLSLSAFFNSMTAFSGSAYMVTKNTAPIFYSSLSAAVINILLNALLIPSIGEMGAAVSTALSYATSWLVRMVKLRNNTEIIVKNIIPFIMSIVLSFIVSFYYFEYYRAGVILGFALVVGVFFLVKSDLINMLQELFPKVKLKNMGL